MKIPLPDGSGTRDYKYLWSDPDPRGNPRIYYARPGQKKVRLLEEPGSPAFDAEYYRAFTGQAPAAPPTKRQPALSTSLRWLVQQYYGSAAFRSLGESTRAVRRSLLDQVCERWGIYDYRTIEPRHVAQSRDEKSEFPEAANGRVKALRQMFAWAALPEYAFVTSNPAAVVSYLKSNNPGGFKPWSEADVEKFETRHPVGTKARLALDLFLYTGVRRSDVVKLGPQMERWVDHQLADGSMIRVQKLCFAETKGRGRIVKEHAITILPALRASIDATPSGHLTYLATEQGRPYSWKGFGAWFKRRCREAGVDAEVSAHGLRKFGAQRVAEQGGTEHQLMALYGWESPKQAALYTRNARRQNLEAAAVQMLDRGQSQNKNPLTPRVLASVERIRRKT